MIKRNSILENLSVAVIANIVSLLGSTIITFLLPKFIGVTPYSYYQLYVFYASYVGFFGLGWLEGLYLRYGGVYYDKLDKELISSQLYIFSLLELFITMVVMGIAFVFTSGEKTYVFFMFALCIIVYLPRALLHNILQTTGRIKEYATGLIIDKSVHIVLTLTFVVLKFAGFRYFVASELIGRICGSVYICVVCRDIVFSQHKMGFSIKKIFPEIRENIYVGVPLMLSNVASMLVIGVIRQMIEVAWDVETFGKVSLTLTISNLLMTFINSVALVLFPMLKRMESDKLKSFYSVLRGGIMIPLLAMLVAYYPMRLVLSYWIPKYAESLKYMALLFPMCIYECKMSLLLNTYLKALREERILLKINVVAVSVSAILGGVSCLILKNLDFAILSIVIVLAVRSIYAEKYITDKFCISTLRDTVQEVSLSVVFIVSSWFIGGFAGTAVYTFALVVYFVVNKKQVLSVLKSIEAVIKH